MKLAHFVAVALTLALATTAAPAAAQSNDNDYTPLNSRIKRDRQFPTDLPQRFDPSIWTKVQHERSRAMLGQFTHCIYRRSHEDSLDLIAKTDLGFVSFEQIGLTQKRALRIYGFKDCLSRVATMNSSGLTLRFSAGALRQWVIQEAYLDRFPDSPDWVHPGWTVRARGELPLSEGNAAVISQLDFADCVVANAPYEADLYFRTAAGSDSEGQVLKQLVPALGKCIPQGVSLRILPEPLRIWLGEALWHASQNIGPPVKSVDASAGD